MLFSKHLITCKAMGGGGGDFPRLGLVGAAETAAFTSPAFGPSSAGTGSLDLDCGL